MDSCHSKFACIQISKTFFKVHDSDDHSHINIMWANCNFSCHDVKLPIMGNMALKTTI